MTIGSTTRDGLIAGNYPLVAIEIKVAGASGGTPTEFLRGDVVGITSDGRYILADSTATNGSQNVVGIICDDVKVESGAEAVTTMYIKGEFNQRFMRFGGNDTVERHSRRMIEIGLIPRETRI